MLSIRMLIYEQACRQDVAERGGHIFKIQYWMYAATGGPNVKWGGRAPLVPATALSMRRYSS